MRADDERLTKTISQVLFSIRGSGSVQRQRKYFTEYGCFICIMFYSESLGLIQGFVEGFTIHFSIASPLRTILSV